MVHTTRESPSDLCTLAPSFGGEVVNIVQDWISIQPPYDFLVKSLACMFLVMLGSLTTIPSISGDILT